VILKPLLKLPPPSDLFYPARLFIRQPFWAALAGTYKHLRVLVVPPQRHALKAAGQLTTSTIAEYRGLRA